MKRLLLILCMVLALTGCASLLEREFLSVEEHPQVPVADEDSNTVWVENYQELLSTILYQVRQGETESQFRIRNYDGDVSAALTRACQEVAQEDPFGAYAVSGISYNSERVVTYHAVTIQATYCRSQSQRDSILNVTGASSIRTQLGKGMTSFAPEVVLQIDYFGRDADYIEMLAQQAYFSNPQTALGMPDITVNLYPETGMRRVVEVLFQYPFDAATMRVQANSVLRVCDGLVQPVLDRNLDVDERIVALWEVMPDIAEPAVGVVADEWTIYHLFSGQGGDSQAQAIGFQLLCDLAKVDCQVVVGSRDGQPYYWNIVGTQSGYRHMVVDRAPGGFYTDDEFVELVGAEWSRGTYPICREKINSEEIDENP